MFVESLGSLVHTNDYLYTYLENYGYSYKC